MLMSSCLDMRTSPAIFQKDYRNTVEGNFLRAAYVDEILVTGTTELEHLNTKKC